MERNSDFIEAMRLSQTAIMKQYSHNRKIIIRKDLLPFDKEEFQLDYIDFYCLVEYFTPKEFIELITETGLQQIEFVSIQSIENSIVNFLNYYKKHYFSVDGEYAFSNRYYDDKLKRIVTVARYIKLSEEVTKKIIDIILNKEFPELRINEKVLFISKHVYEFKTFNKNIRNCILNTLVQYITQCFDARMLGKSFELVSTNYQINYYSLSHCLSLPDIRFISSKLSMIIEKYLPEMNSGDLVIVFENYLSRIQKNIKERVFIRSHILLAEEFSFDLFKNIMASDPKNLLELEVNALLDYIRTTIPAIEAEQAGRMRIRPSADSHLVDLAYWGLMGFIKTDIFIEFLGISEHADFLYDPANFDYNNFECGWIIDLYDSVHKKLASLGSVKEKIKNAVLHYLNKDTVFETEQTLLYKILLDYYT